MTERKEIGFLINGISLSPEKSEQACLIAEIEMKRAGLNPARLRFDIYRRSVDARKKDALKLVYSVAVRSKDGDTVTPPKKCKYSTSILYDDQLDIETGSERMKFPPLVVGMGPAGLFCALVLAENGYAPIIIDRGDGISDRCRAHSLFVEKGVLDVESNIQFGAGGAGTFSDGKLMTRVNDPRNSYVLKRFCDFGAPDDIKVAAKPHIGTDLLLGVVNKMLSRIEELGGKVIYRCCLEEIKEKSSSEVIAKTSKGDIECSALILAVGHSARDTYGMLIDSGYAVEAKPFSVGVRIEHFQENIDRALYGRYAGYPNIGHAEYHLSDTTSGRGVYTFCMCPGGEVVAAASEEGGVVVNGMSRYARDGKNANSAVCVSILPQDFGNTPMSAIAFQREIEHAAFVIGGNDYSAPVQTVGDFLNEKQGTEPSTVLPSYRNGKVKLSRMDDVLPNFVCKELRRGLLSFEKKVSGFASSDAVLSGAETRTSSPIRILRTEEMTALGHCCIYPCGEGAGYAGGITSAAVDGIKTAQNIIKRFAPILN